MCGPDNTGSTVLSLGEERGYVTTSPNDCWMPPHLFWSLLCCFQLLFPKELPEGSLRKLCCNLAIVAFHDRYKVLMKRWIYLNSTPRCKLLDLCFKSHPLLSFLMHSVLQVLQLGFFLGGSEVTVVGELVDMIPGFSNPL